MNKKLDSKDLRNKKKVVYVSDNDLSTVGGDDEMNRILRACRDIATTDSKGLASLKRFISETLKDKA